MFYISLRIYKNAQMFTVPLKRI